MKTRVAVFFGGRSPEHDISIVTGLQVLHAVDQQRFSAFPVYVSTAGKWLVGDALRDQRNYLPRGPVLDHLESVTLDVTPNIEGVGHLLPRESKRLFSRAKPIEFDVALLAFHGLYGEDGPVQGVFEMAGVPYTGMRLMGTALAMDKAATKRCLRGTDISLLPDVVIDRPRSGLIPSAEEVAAAVGGLRFPAIVKPMHLGSSIAVAKVENLDELRIALPAVFKFDNQAIVEPFVDNLVEYNVAVRCVDGTIQTSAIEKPKRTTELLDFVSKYMSGGGGSKSGSKQPGELKPGLLALTREVGPRLSEEFESKICRWATTCFALLGATGAPRIDFLCDSVSNELWLNEVNPCPGSFGFFLWEAAREPILFPELISFLIDEAIACHRARRLPDDPTYPEARLFERS